MHIIAGSLRRRKLEALPDQTIRPTASRTREAIFNVVSHARRENGESYLIDQPIADICSGSGAMGLEAISRGATFGVFVDANRESLGVARENAGRCAVGSQCRFVNADATRLPACPPQGPFSLIFTDPPYQEKLLPRILQSIYDNGWLAEGGMIIAEQHAADALPEAPPFTLENDRTYGKARILFYRF